MKRFVVGLVSLAVLVGGIAVPAVSAQGAATGFRHLVPGGQPELVERLPVNVVFVGYDPATVDLKALETGLPSEYEPVVRSRLWYGEIEKVGIRYEYDYNVTVADDSYEDRLFGELARLATPAPLNVAQTAYNDQSGNALEVTENVEIDAPTVERWLAYNAPSGVDTERNTVFLINWFDRDDFRFHVYTKTDEPDPDTGFNFGAELSSRNLTAWGGTTSRDEENGLGSTRRVWFHDLSAGPEVAGGSYNVDDADLDGDDVPDYRIPPVWEYGAYRPASELTADLGRLIRFVALDLLFTTSPLYPTELPTEYQPRTIDIDANTYEGWAGVDASAEYITPALVQSELQELLPFRKVTYDDQDFSIDPLNEQCYLGVFLDDPCYSDDFPAFANLYLYNRENLARTKDDGDTVDYELPVFNYAVDDEPVPALGYADDNYVDGTQSYVFAFVSPDVVSAGYGLSTSIIHEVGHHVGLSHPHDGYDATSGVDFEPTGDMYYAWLGDYNNSMMSYIDLNWDFSQFDQDNLNRFATASSIEGANALAAAALAGPDAHRAVPVLRAADAAIGVAEAAFARHEYTAALAASTTAYYIAVKAVKLAGGTAGAPAPGLFDATQPEQLLPKPDGTDAVIDPFDVGPRGTP